MNVHAHENERRYCPKNPISVIISMLSCLCGCQQEVAVFSGYVQASLFGANPVAELMLILKDAWELNSIFPICPCKMAEKECHIPSCFGHIPSCKICCAPQAWSRQSVRRFLHLSLAWEPGRGFWKKMSTDKGNKRMGHHGKSWKNHGK